MASHPPLQEGELVPGMEIVVVHNAAIRAPRRLRVDSFPRFTPDDGLHLKATDLETGEPWVIRHGAIYIPREDSGDHPPDWCAYPLANANLAKIGGFVPQEVAGFDKIGLVDFSTLQEYLRGFQIVQAGEPMPANSYYAVLRITDVASHIQIALVRGAMSSDRREAFIPPIARAAPVNQYGDRIFDIAVIIPGVDGIDPDIPDNEISRWANPLTSQQVAERLVHVAEHLEQIGDPASGEFGPGMDHVMEAKLGAIQRALVNLAPHCGAEESRISEVALHVRKVVQHAEAYRKADLVAGAMGLGSIKQPNFTWAKGARSAASHVRSSAQTLGAQAEVQGRSLPGQLT